MVDNKEARPLSELANGAPSMLGERTKLAVEGTVRAQRLCTHRFCPPSQNALIPAFAFIASASRVTRQRQPGLVFQSFVQHVRMNPKLDDRQRTAVLSCSTTRARRILLRLRHLPCASRGLWESRDELAHFL